MFKLYKILFYSEPLLPSVKESYLSPFIGHASSYSFRIPNVGTLIQWQRVMFLNGTNYYKHLV